ncbi:SLC13 family permease [Thalassotalea agarivorans]|uniref:Di-and tricarboxylate transporter n=2 Tax=Thalassotalea agarivorans TaxID=349064 RepID=A0A1H9YKJ6_THASX|nr:SLC13 family permease [Thalassotalea agarivorans]SES69573.1 Di-and tricarboxylate transporter [Thalassotalea agarivorans]
MLMQLLMLAIFVGTFVGLFKFQDSPARVFMGTILACLIFSFVSSEEVLKNAVNPGLVTLLLLVLASFAIERTSILRKISSTMLSGSRFKTTLKTLSITAVSSALMNNTAVVASLISTIKANTVINPGKLLIPLSFAAILGGTLTLVGTSTNLIVNSLFIDKGYSGFNFFDFTLIGLAALLACFVVIILRRNSLPNMELENVESAEYFVEAEVSAESKLIGLTIEENDLRKLDSLFLVEIIRNDRLISPVAPDEFIHAGDKLIFTGDISKVKVLQQFDGLTLFAEKDGLLRENLTEVLVKPGAAIIGKSLKSAGFRARFDAAVVALRREGGVLSGKLGDIVIQAGDYLVLAVGNDFSSRTNLSKNFYILSGHEPDNILSGWRDISTIAGFIFTIAISVVTDISLLSCLFFYLSFLVFSGGLNVDEIKRRFPLEIWTIVLGALTLATALENSGVMVIFAQWAESLLAGQSIYVAFVLVFFITLLTTELVTNNAAAALVFPIAYNLALAFDVNIMPFVMAVAFGASGSFISPYGYQTNVMVFNAANYKIQDFIKFGIPVSITYSAVVLYMIPKVFPF